ncbi:glycosyltransferase family 2 protein [Lutibacter citreus]|uniref:glycosyltransferase family 2 protein n=1 Tax=Lutibacter citreus TaxID=2138210 RepID=UPI000DBE145C|nr:glycosyltransferase family A protein [Lutibacter citreus]
MVEIGVIIATSFDRIDLLLNRSLKSVLDQTIQPNCIVIVDDNEDDIYLSNCRLVEGLSIPNLHYLRNIKSKGMSGTGAWNTGIEFLKNNLGLDNYLAILDDDDFWENTYLQDSYDIIKNQFPKAIFSYLKRGDCKYPHKFNLSELNLNNFLIGNPGIQGSNMIFKLSSIDEINGFDENLRSCTDRDLMIRFLQTHGRDKIRINQKVLVQHFVGHKTVTSNLMAKQEGLDFFYKKHFKLFNQEMLKSSLERSKKLFKYNKSDEVIELYKNYMVNG